MYTINYQYVIINNNNNKMDPYTLITQPYKSSPPWRYSSETTYMYEGLRPWGRIVPIYDNKKRPEASPEIVCFDIQKAFLTILYDICTKFNIECPIVTRLLHNFNEECESMNIISMKKDILYSILFNVDSVNRRSVKYDPYTDYIKKHPKSGLIKIEKFRNEINTIIKKLIPHYKLEYYYAQKELSDPNIVQNYWFMQTPTRIDREHLFLHIVLGTVEHEIISKLYYHIKDKICVNSIVYDGIICSDNNPENIHKTLNICNNYIHKFYPNINFKIKHPFNSSLEYDFVYKQTIDQEKDGSSCEYDIDGEVLEKFVKFQQKLKKSITPCEKQKKYFKEYVLEEIISKTYEPDGFILIN